MKNVPKLSMILAIIMMIGLAFVSCTKEGPAGLPGADGKDGVDGRDGEDGIDGMDGAATCAVCHDNSEVSTYITRHWEMSQHAMGNTYLRNSANCAGCHTSQGFREVIATGAAAPAEAIANPNPPNCYTCHKIHDEYTSNDWELTFTSSFALHITGDVVDHGKGNLCASCHQPRQPSPMPEFGGDDIEIPNFRWGPHYGSPGAIAAGKGGYEIADADYPNSAHVNAVGNSCVTCHMVENHSEQAGGHMFNLSYGDPESPDVLTSACTACHSNEETLATLMASTKSQLDDLMAELNTRLKEIGIMSETNQPVSGTWTADEAGALLNHQLVKYDGSNGVHNFPYAKALLENSIASLE